MAVDVEIPGMGESVTEVILIEWLKGDGEQVERDEPICVLETDKANVDLPAPAAGVLYHLKELDETLEVGDLIARIGEEGEAVERQVAPAEEAAPAVEEEEEGVEPAAAEEKEEETVPAAEKVDEPDLSPAVRRLVEEHDLDPAAIERTGKGGRLTKGDVLAFLESQKPKAEEPAPEKTVVTPEPAPVEPQKPKSEPAPKPAPAPQEKSEKTAARPVAPPAEEGEVRRVPMTRIRQRIAKHLVAAQQNAAMLTTFNEVDMSQIMALRTEYKERFTEVHGVSLGFMSFFSRAVVIALGEFPAVNASIDGTDILYHDYVNLGIAVSTERGLLVPILQRAERMSMAQIESEIKRLALGARDNRLAMEELSGGTFTITNGGVFGSLLSTPIINVPQSAILGMHAIQQRPVAIDGQVEIRPMMYVALSYDHRLIDGKTSVSFLVRIKQLLEDPARMLLQV